jgi:hypothetical protein
MRISGEVSMRVVGFVVLSLVSTGCYSETIGPYVTEIVVAKDGAGYKVTRCMINLDHGLFGSVSPSKGECTTDKLPSVPPSTSSAGVAAFASKTTPK